MIPVGLRRVLFVVVTVLRPHWCFRVGSSVHHSGHDVFCTLFNEEATEQYFHVVDSLEHLILSSVPPNEANAKRVYSVKELLQLKQEGESDVPFFKYVITKAHPLSRSTTPNSQKARDSSANNYHRMSIRSASPMIFYMSGEKRVGSRSVTPLIRKPGDSLSEVDQVGSSPHPRPPEELMDYYADDPASLPQGDVMGRIQWMHQNNGRIRMIGKVLSTRDLFFHFNDVELKDGQSLNVGDRVVFEISVYKNLVCAKHIRKFENTRSKSSVNVHRHSVAE